MTDNIEAWKLAALACPRCKAPVSGELECTKCGVVGRWIEGIACFSFSEDEAISWYKAKGGSNFRERVSIPYTMSSLDTHVYHSYLAELKKGDVVSSTIVDIGSGDGRNSEPWLAWGSRQVIAVDAIYESLARLRDYVAKEKPEWLPYLLLVQSDARLVPLKSGIADTVLAIEILYHLNDDFTAGVKECARLMKPDGRFMLSEPTNEGSYLTSLLYGGPAAMVEMHKKPECFEKAGESVLRSRTFTVSQLSEILTQAGLEVTEVKGICFLSTLMGYLRGAGKITREDERLFPAICELLADAGRKLDARRTHIVVAKPAVIQ